MRTKISTLLQQSLARKKLVNPRYSIRAFARHLGISQTTLSFVLNGTRKPSIEVLEKIISALNIPEDKRSQLLTELSDEYDYIDLTVSDNRQLTSSWYYFAILSLAELTGIQLTSLSVSRRLNIPVSRAKRALDFLTRKGFLVSEDGRLLPSGYRFNLGNHASVRRIHGAVLKKALDVLLNLSDPSIFENSDFSEVFIAMDAEDVLWAKEEIRKFRRSLTRKLERKGSKNSVVALCIQLLPLAIEPTPD